MPSKRLSQFTRQVIVDAVMEDIPTPDPDDIERELQAALSAAMDPAILEFAKKYPNSLRTKSIGNEYGLGWPYREFVIGNLKDGQIDAALQSFEHLQTARDEAKAKLKAALAGMRTEDDVRKHFPELEKYLDPKTIPSSNLPALANVMSDLVKLGWPKSKK